MIDYTLTYVAPMACTMPVAYLRSADRADITPNARGPTYRVSYI